MTDHEHEYVFRAYDEVVIACIHPDCGDEMDIEDALRILNAGGKMKFWEAIQMNRVLVQLNIGRFVFSITSGGDNTQNEFSISLLGFGPSIDGLIELAGLSIWLIRAELCFYTEA